MTISGVGCRDRCTAGWFFLWIEVVVLVMSHHCRLCQQKRRVVCRQVPDDSIDDRNVDASFHRLRAVIVHAVRSV